MQVCWHVMLLWEQSTQTIVHCHLYGQRRTVGVSATVMTSKVQKGQKYLCANEFERFAQDVGES